MTNATPILQTERLSLRPLHSDDAPFLRELLGSEAVRHYLGGPVPDAQIPARIAGWLGSDDKIWLVVRRDDKQPCGMVFLGHHGEEDALELSYLFAPACWGQGFAFEAISHICDWARETQGNPRLVAETQAANIASLKLLARLGFTEQRRCLRHGAEQVICTR